MPTLKPPTACDHIAAPPGWFLVVAVELPNGGVELDGEPIIAFRMDTFQIEGPRGAAVDRFTSATPILAGGSVGEASDYVLQKGDAYYSGDQTFHASDEVIEHFRKRARKQNRRSPKIMPFELDTNPNLHTLLLKDCRTVTVAGHELKVAPLNLGSLVDLALVSLNRTYPTLTRSELMQSDTTFEELLAVVHATLKGR